MSHGGDPAQMLTKEHPRLLPWHGGGLVRRKLPEMARCGRVSHRPMTEVAAGLFPREKS